MRTEGNYQDNSHASASENKTDRFQWGDRKKKDVDRLCDGLLDSWYICEKI